MPRRLLEAQPCPASEDSTLFDAEYRRHLVLWAAGRVRGEFSEVAWQAFWRAGVEGHPPKEVAQALEICLGTVYQYKSRAVVRIRREIEQHGVGTGTGPLVEEQTDDVAAFPERVQRITTEVVSG